VLQTAARSSASNGVSLTQQISSLFILAMPVACVAWIVTHEAVLGEFQEFCRIRSKECSSVFKRKFFYLFTCEFCLSHYVTVLFLAITRFKLLFPDWRGYLVSLFSLVWVANQYISIYDRLRLDIKREHISIDAQQEREQPSAQRPRKAA
jgi:hypothetical protein